MVWFVVYVKVGIMALLTLFFLMSGIPLGFILFLLLTLLTAFMFFLWRDELNLIASMLSVATQGLRDNPHIVSMTIGLQFTTLAYIFPAVGLMMYANMNGHGVVNPKATDYNVNGEYVCTNYMVRRCRLTSG